MIVRSTDDTEWGMAANHRRVLKQVANEENCFIIARPSEADSVRLIKDGGYGTKSMDIHDKSSTWGPMAGFVPLDQSLCKKVIIGKQPSYPVPNTLELVHDAKSHKHGYEEPVQLYLSESVKQYVLKSENLAGPCVNKRIEMRIRDSQVSSAAELNRQPLGLIAEYRTLTSGGLEAVEFKAKYIGPASIEVASDPTKRAVTETTFMLVKLGERYYAWWVFGQGVLIPILVWGYPITEGSDQVAPVTGDYDLWMVVPHIKYWNSHYKQKAHTDRHRVPSVASGFTHGLLQRLNRRCQREQLPVFNHGAEAQNFMFTQPLDLELLLITPGRRSYRLNNEDIPVLMTDMLTCGYLPIWNARYEIDAKAVSFDKSQQERMHAIRDRIYKEVENRLEYIEESKSKRKSQCTISEIVAGKKVSGLQFDDFRPEALITLGTDAADYLRGVTSIVMQVNQAVVRERGLWSNGKWTDRTPSVGTTSYTDFDKEFIKDTLRFIGLNYGI